MELKSTQSKYVDVSRWLFNIVVLLLLFIVGYFHNYRLSNIPLGLFFDESTIGIQASKLLQPGFEAFGGEVPIYFKSDADYDSPILIYSTAAIFKLFGVSEYTLRVPNLIFFLIALILTFWLVSKLFDNIFVRIYLIIAFGFLPQFFTLSRLSFEAISQLMFMAGASLGIWWTFQEENSSVLNFVKPILSGLLIGISVYTYSTASLLSVLFMISVLIIYISKENLIKFLAMISATLVALIPYAIFSFTNPGALTSRFKNITFVFEQIPFIEKLGIFLSNYFSYWSLDFLVQHGDANLRHSTGYGGIVFVSVLILFVIGLVDFFLTLARRCIDRFELLLIVNLFISPIASALTSEGNPHAVRAVLLGYFIVLISCYGFQLVFKIKDKLILSSSIVFILFFLVIEVYKYQFDYFVHYASRSVDAIGSFDLYGAIEFAIEERPKEIILFDNNPGVREDFLFYSQVIDDPEEIPLRLNPLVIPRDDICIIYQRLSGAEGELDKSPLSYVQFSSRYHPSDFEKKHGLKKFFGVIKVRCYSGQ